MTRTEKGPVDRAFVVVFAPEPVTYRVREKWSGVIRTATVTPPRGPVAAMEEVAEWWRDQEWAEPGVIALECDGWETLVHVGDPPPVDRQPRGWHPAMMLLTLLGRDRGCPQGGSDPPTARPAPERTPGGRIKSRVAGLVWGLLGSAWRAAGPLGFESPPCRGGAWASLYSIL